MATFCAGCAGDVTNGAVVRGGWVYCSVECAQAPGHWMSRFLNLSAVLVRPDLELALARQPLPRSIPVRPANLR
jgi:hypothetical protein